MKIFKNRIDIYYKIYSKSSFKNVVLTLLIIKNNVFN